jgi:hypothetical protein
VIVLAGQDNHLGVRGGSEDFLEQAETFGNRVRIGGSPRSIVTTAGEWR